MQVPQIYIHTYIHIHRMQVLQYNTETVLQYTATSIHIYIHTYTQDASASTQYRDSPRVELQYNATLIHIYIHTYTQDASASTQYRDSPRVELQYNATLIHIYIHTYTQDASASTQYRDSPRVELQYNGTLRVLYSSGCNVEAAKACHVAYSVCTEKESTDAILGVSFGDELDGQQTCSAASCMGAYSNCMRGLKCGSLVPGASQYPAS